MFPLDKNAPLSPKKISITTKSKILFLSASSTSDSVILEGTAPLFFSILPFSPFLSSIPSLLPNLCHFLCPLVFFSLRSLVYGLPESPEPVVLSPQYPHLFFSITPTPLTLLLSLAPSSFPHFIKEFTLQKKKEKKKPIPPHLSRAMQE